MAVNGQLSTRGLMLVQDDDLFLARGTGWAWRRLKTAVGSNLGRRIGIAAKAGAYRSLQVQAAIRAAYDSRNPRRMAEWNLDPGSHVRPADPGGSNHGLGIAVDIVGTPIDAALITLARRYGFTFPYLRGDPRHAVHDQRTGVTPIAPPIDRRKMGLFLNRRLLGRHTGAEKSGVADGDYVWLLQTAGHHDGLYPTPPYRRDGRWGPRTRWLEGHYWGRIR